MMMTESGEDRYLKLPPIQQQGHRMFGVSRQSECDSGAYELFE